MIPSSVKPLGAAIQVRNRSTKDEVFFNIDITKSVRDKRYELSRKILQALALQDFNVAADRYVVTVKRVKK
jgi:hypothetical protein